MSHRGWVRFFARFMLGLIFFMAGWHKCFVMTPLGHARFYGSATARMNDARVKDTLAQMRAGPQALG